MSGYVIQEFRNQYWPFILIRPLMCMLTFHTIIKLDICIDMKWKVYVTHRKVVHLLIKEFFEIIKLYCIIIYLPTKFSNTELFPALWLPTTAIWGRSKERGRPKDAKASCNLFTIGISCSIPTFPAILAICFRVLYYVDSHSIHGGSWYNESRLYQRLGYL